MINILPCMTRREAALVIAIAPIFSEKLVAPLPVPKIPASIQPIPSVVMPRLIACRGGGGSEQISANE